MRNTRSAAFSRRQVLLGVGALSVWAHIPRFAAAAGHDPRLIVVLLRGGLDGLATVPPLGDPSYQTLRGSMAVSAETALSLDGFFGLNAAMPHLHALYRDGQATIVHATATPYRERSHFDGQDVLESGAPAPHATATGWLGRAIEALPAGQPIRPARAVTTTLMRPLILRGRAPVITWTPASMAEVAPDTEARLLDLYRRRDPKLATALREGLETRDVAMRTLSDDPQAKRFGATFQAFASGTARLMAQPDGPRIGVLDFGGWDTHVLAGPVQGRMAKLLQALDLAVDALRGEMEARWRDTVVVLITEFGRTARANGSAGTDHGTGTIAILAGGAVRGGRILADWPGLRSEQLYQGRDLKPTIDLRAILKGVLRDHLGLSERLLAASVFPASESVRPVDDLLI